MKCGSREATDNRWEAPSQTWHQSQSHTVFAFCSFYPGFAASSRGMSRCWSPWRAVWCPLVPDQHTDRRGCVCEKKGKLWIFRQQFICETLQTLVFSWLSHFFSWCRCIIHSLSQLQATRWKKKSLMKYQGIFIHLTSFNANLPFLSLSAYCFGIFTLYLIVGQWRRRRWSGHETQVLSRTWTGDTVVMRINIIIIIIMNPFTSLHYLQR